MEKGKKLKVENAQEYKIYTDNVSLMFLVNEKKRELN